MNNVYLCEWQSAVLVLYVLWQPYSAGCALSPLSLSLMCFPCVLERQTQLHFNDTQMLLGFRIHVYVCVCVRVCVHLDHFSEKPVEATPALYNCPSICPQNLACASVCASVHGYVPKRVMKP